MKQEFLDKILDMIDDKGEIIGGLYGLASDPISGGRGISLEAFNFMIGRLSQWKLKNPLAVIAEMTKYPEAYPIMEEAMAVVGGWLLNELGGILDPKVAKLGRGIKKTGMAAMLGSIVGAQLWLPGIMNGNGGAASLGGNGGTVTY